MTPERALERADTEAASILNQKQRDVFNESRPFTVIRAPAEPPMARADSGPTSRPVSLATALELAARHSREYQRQKESLYRSALGLITARERFRFSPFFSFSGDGTSDHSRESVGAGGELGVTKVLERGGSFALSTGVDFLRFVSNPTSTSLTTFLNLVISLPLLRGAGEDVAMENLTQADRDVLYSLRDFERFRQTFAVDVETRYLRLLESRRRVTNEERNLDSITEARKRNEAFAEAQRLTEIEVDQARQDELRARDRLLAQRNALETSLDEFKQSLGMPIGESIALRDEDLDPLVAAIKGNFRHDAESVVARARSLRLDLQNLRDHIDDAQRRIKIAENELLPKFDLGLTGKPASENLKPLRMKFDNGRYVASVDGDLGLDRDNEAVNLRAAHLDLAAAVRAHEELDERVNLEVRAAVRSVAQAAEQYRIQDRAVAVARRRVDSVKEFILRGDGTTRDLLEAQDALVNAENDLVGALVEHRIAYLGFFRDAGALAVSPEGLDHETSDALLTTP